MPIIRRTQKPPRQKDYQSYKLYLRLDFGFSCAYCGITELRWGSDRNFVVEHFRPKAKFPELIRAYSNLYYACNRCNEFKGSRWPLAAMIRRGFRFGDPCREDIYAAHLRELPDGSLEPLTRCGEYMIAHVGLNRPMLSEWRQQRRQLLDDIAAAETAVALLRRSMRPTLPAKALETLEQLIARHQSLCARLRSWY